MICVPPSPCDPLCQNTSKQRSGNTRKTEYGANQTHIGRDLRRWNCDGKNGVDSTGNTSSTGTLDCSSDGESSAVWCNGFCQVSLHA